MRKGILIAIAVIAALVTLYHFGGWRPVLSLLGFREEPNYELANYRDKTDEVLDDWQATIRRWEDSPIQNNAQDIYVRMSNVMTSWKDISPPDDCKPYHSYILQAMQYDKDAMWAIATAPPDNLSSIHSKLNELWALKDDALKKAQASWSQ